MHISETLNLKNTIGTIGINKNKPIGTIVKPQTQKLTKDEVLACDVALSMFADLIHPDFKLWHCKVFYQLGRDRYAQLASIARADGSDPARLFSHLLRGDLKAKL